MKKQPDKSAPPDIDEWEKEIAEVMQFCQPEEKPQAPLIISEITPSLSYEGVYNPNSFSPLFEGNIDNLDGKTGDKFVKGKLKIEARLDLHGYTEKEAFAKVVDFIQNAYIKGLRCVLVITGKGLKNKDEPWYETKGVIKEAFPSWLNNNEIRPFVLSFSQASQNDGGSGAFYVLLKRKRISNKTK